MHANGIRFHVAEVDGAAAAGPLVLLLHGFPEFWWSWRHQLVALADGGAVREGRLAAAVERHDERVGARGELRAGAGSRRRAEAERQLEAPAGRQPNRVRERHGHRRLVLFALPRRDSIARRLIEDWLHHGVAAPGAELPRAEPA